MVQLVGREQKVVACYVCQMGNRGLGFPIFHAVLRFFCSCLGAQVKRGKGVA